MVVLRPLERRTLDWLAELLEGPLDPSALTKSQPSLSDVHSQQTVDVETEQIKQSAQTGRAQKPHKFVAAQWTHPNGHPRCKICGCEETLGAMCPGLKAERAQFGPGAAGSKKEKSMSTCILKADEDQHLVYGIVYAADDAMVASWLQKGEESEAPPIVDSQGEYCSEATLEKAFDAFMKHHHQMLVQKGIEAAGVEHSELAKDVVLMQSAILPRGTRWPDANSEPLPFAKNWVRCDYIEDPALWAKIKAEEITGYSIGGFGERGTEA